MKIEKYKIIWNNEKIKDDIIDHIIDQNETIWHHDDPNYNNQKEREKLKKLELEIITDDFDINDSESYINVELGGFSESWDNDNDLIKYYDFEIIKNKIDELQNLNNESRKEILTQYDFLDFVDYPEEQQEKLFKIKKKGDYIIIEIAENPKIVNGCISCNTYEIEEEIHYNEWDL